MQQNSFDHEVNLITRCQAGDDLAFAEIVEKYQQKIFAHLFRRIGSREIAEEMTQEVFFKVYAQIKNFRGEARFSTWLYQITLNLCRDHWRNHSKRAIFVESKNADLASISTTDSVEKDRLEKEQNDELRKTILSLPEKYQTCITLRFFDELSYDEISEVLGEKVSNVKMRVVRGLELLRKKWPEAS